MSAQMDVQIKIEASSKQAQASVENLSNSFKQLKVVADNTGESLSNVETAAAPQIGAFTRAGAAVGAFGEALDNLERRTKKFGRELTQNVSVPILALAGLSLKNLYDEGAKLGSSGPARDFALLIQTIGDNFKALSITIAQDFQPVVTSLLGIVNNFILYFQGLDAETRKTIVTFGLIAAAVGPAVLALAGLMSVVSQLAIVLAPIGAAIGTALSALFSPSALIIALTTSIAGLINVFFKLKEAGSSTAEALQLSFNFFVTGFNNFVVGTLLDGIGLIISSFSKLAGVFSSDIKASLDAASQAVSGWSKTLEQRFAANKLAIDTQLSKIGSSAADAMTFGFSSKMEDFQNKIAELFSSASKTATNSLTKAEEEEIDKVSDELQAKIDARSTQMKNIITGNLAGAFTSIATGAKTAEQAFSDFASSTITNLIQMITQALLFKAIFPNGGWASNFIAEGAAIGMATGGYVQGPGSGTSDSIAARLSNGEYVMDAKTVRKYGVDFFRNLQSFGRNGLSAKGRGSHIPGYADGGLVTSPSSSTPQVIIQNSGSPKEVESSTYDPASAVTTVVLADIQKNGPISKSLQGAYGVRRSGRL